MSTNEKLIKGIKALQREIIEQGLGASSLVVVTPSTVLAPGYHIDSDDITALFNASIALPEIHDVTSDLFASGFYSQAVYEAYKAVEKSVAQHSGVTGLTGSKLMRSVFSKDNPKLFWSTRNTISEKDEHEGYQHIFAGAMLGIRNPSVHEFDWIEDPATALDLIIIAQHLIKKAKQAQKL